MAWAELEPILLREGVVRAAPPLIDRLNDVTKASDPAARRKALDAIIATADDAQRLIRVLSGESAALPHRLALELATRLADSDGSLEPVLAAWLRPLLRDRRIPSRVRLAATVALTRSAPRRKRRECCVTSPSAMVPAGCSNVGFC
jgi:hypothetical protein